jgi:hypothetical protein
MPHHLVNKNPARRGVRAGSLPTLRYNEAPADQPINQNSLRDVISIDRPARRELRRLLARLAWSRPLRRIAPELWLQVRKINEGVSLTPQFVSHHRRLTDQDGDDGNVHAAALHRFQQRTEVAIAREQKHSVDMIGELHRIDGQLDIHAALHMATLRRNQKLKRAYRKGRL